jgi:DNA-binding transcriptional ArsR family regulator
MDVEIESMAPALRALGNANRLLILSWISDPERHFPPQVDGDLVADGVCVGFITEKIGLSQPTVTTHMQVLAGAGLVSQKKIRNWVFYKPVRPAIAALLARLDASLKSGG